MACVMFSMMFASQLALIRMDLSSTKATGSAGQRLAAVLEAQPSAPAVHTVHAELLTERGLDNLAYLSWQRANDTDAQGNFDTRSRRIMARIHLRRGRLRAARVALESLVGRGDTLGDFLALANLALRSDRALRLLFAFAASGLPLKTSELAQEARTGTVPPEGLDAGRP